MTKAWQVSGVDPSGTLVDNARRILAVRMAEFYSYAPIVLDETAVTELHNLRIATKRLRYTLELFRTAFGEPGEKQIERVRDVQELLGQIHDHDVRIELIQDELKVLASEQTVELGRTLASSPTTAHNSITAAALRPQPDDPRRGLLGLLGRQYTTRHNTYISFVELWIKLAEEGMRTDLVRLSARELPDRSTEISVT